MLYSYTDTTRKGSFEFDVKLNETLKLFCFDRRWNTFPKHVLLVSRENH